MKYPTFMLAAFFFAVATAAGLSAVNPQQADAAGGGPVKKCGGGKILLNAKEKETLARHNAIRRDNKLRPFCIHPKLQKAARAHSKDMIRRDYFSHNTKGRGSFSKRIKRFGYTSKGYKYYTVGENIAGGNGPNRKPKAIMRAWMKSPGHRRNILDGKFREIGLGTYSGTYKKYKGWTMYTADFGTRRR